MVNLCIAWCFILHAINLHCYTHYANEIITESAIITSRAWVNFKFSLGAVRLSIIELVRSTCSANSCRKLRRSAATQSTFPDIGAPHVVSIAATIAIPQNCRYLLEIPISLWLFLLSSNIIFRRHKLINRRRWKI